MIRSAIAILLMILLFLPIQANSTKPRAEKGVLDLNQLELSKVIISLAGERGTGLGLLVVKDLIKINNGTLRIKSRPGKGTSVMLLLPEKPRN